jgi:peptidoglycan biosynthesis protein MviN/MurJ (putative lipid II flippase)
LGTNAIADAYQVGFSLSTWFGVTIASALSTVGVPLLARSTTWRADRAAQFVRCFNWFVLVTSGAGVLVTLAVGVVSLELLETTPSVLDSQLALKFFYCFAVLAAQTVFVGYLVARLMAAQSHGYALAEAVPAIVLMIVVALFTESIASGLVIGTLIGATAHLVIVIALLRMRGMTVGGVERPRNDAVLMSAVLGFAVLLPSQIAIGITAPLDFLLAKSLGEGEVATFGYALRLVALATGISAVALTRVLLPELSHLVARGDESRAFALARRWVSIMLVVGAVAAAFLWLLASPIVTVAFERGAFTAEDTADVAATLRLLGLQMPLYFAGIVWVQWFAAHRRTREIARITLLQVIVKIAASIGLMQWFGLQGVALGTVLMYLIALACLSIAATRAHQQKTFIDA